MSLIEPQVSLPAQTAERGSERARAVRFAAVIATVLGALGSWKLFRNGASGAAMWLIGAAVTMLVYALVHPRGALVLQRGWLRIGTFIGRINSVLLLTVLYVVVVVPIGVLRRIVRRPESSQGSYFLSREARDTKHFEHPY